MKVKFSQLLLCSCIIRFLIFLNFLPEYNLTGLYSNHRVAKVLLWKYFVLPLLPCNEILPQLRRIKNAIKGQMLERADRRHMLAFHDLYIKKFWVKRIRPQRFSVFANMHKTNNAAESLHAAMRTHIPYKMGFFAWFQALNLMVIKKAEDEKVQIFEGEEVRGKKAKEQSEHDK